MNNQEEKFHQENWEMVQQLIDSLDSLIHIYKNGMIPGDPEKSDALYMLKMYFDAFIEFKKTKNKPFRRINGEDSGEYDESISFRELSGTKEGLGLLLKIGHEKMISTSNPVFDSDAGALLCKLKYCEEIIVGNSENHYYILSTKGEKTLKNKTLMASLQKTLCTSIVPQGLINDSFKWSNLYVRRVEMINRYFELKRGEADHIIFSLDETKDMVFGCEINASEETVYVFAGIFDEKIDSHISQIKSIANSGLVDKVVILNSSEEGRILLEGEGLLQANFPQLEYVLL